MGQFLLTNLLPNGVKIAGYGTHRLGFELFETDWTVLFKLLAENQIDPVIAAKFPILEAADANELLESGRVVGNIVLAAPEWL
jgi:NADPH:quinone reductase-like Zn-dependent oxidoreductase